MWFGGKIPASSAGMTIIFKVNVNSICGYENMVMIGDTPRDVNAGKNIGCHSILINRSGKPSQDFGQEYTVINAMEILDLIQI